jgi:hypothetical protein
MTAAPKIANATGEAVTNNKEFLQKGIKVLADATPENIKNVATKIAEVGGKIGREYANVLMQTVDKNNVSKSAIMFGLMQQPLFRQHFNSVTDKTEDKP